MATKPKGSTTPESEKRSGSTSPASLTRRPTKPTTDKSSSTSSNSSSTAKQLPNYLRSTESSSRQLPSLTKSSSLKKPHDSQNQESKSPKPTLNRRRSFDKPPSPSGLQKSLNSPGRELKDAPHRSKSLLVRSVSNVPKRTSKSVSGTKPQGSHAKTSGTGLRRSTSGITSGSSKKDSRINRSTTSSTGSSRAPRSQDITEILNLEANLDALNRHGVGVVDKIESIEEDNCQDFPDPKLAEEDLDDQHQQPASDNGHDISSVNDAAEESKANVDVQNETVIQAEKSIDVHDHDHVEEVNHINKDDESNDIDQDSGLTNEETRIEEVIKEDENKNEEDMVVVDGRIHEHDSKEVQDGDLKEEAKREEAKATEKPQEAAAATAGNNKKEAAPAYNDVIEETTSKLMAQEKRRNKVKALVGAFETVIDYESGSKP